MYLLFLNILKRKTICFAFCAIFCVCANKTCMFDDNLKKYVAKLFVS